MNLERQGDSENSIGMAKINYPLFEAWRSDNLIDNCLCLNIRLGVDQEPILVQGLQSQKDVEEFVKGFEKGQV